jgi:hypothetical protein
MGETSNSNPLGPMKLSRQSEIKFDSVGGYFQGPSSLLVDLTDEPHPRFPVQGHTWMSVGFWGQTLREDRASSFIPNSTRRSGKHIMGFIGNKSKVQL